MATVEEKILEIKMRIEGADSVKELKEIVAELTPQMENLDETSEEYAQTVDVMVAAQEKLTTVMKAGKSQISAQEGSYNALVNRMAALKKVQKSVTDDASRARLAEEINSINDQLKAYDQANGVYVRNVGNYKSALEGFEGTVVSFGDSMREAMETIEPTKQKFESVQKIATGVASGFAALQGVTALLGIENENLEKTLVKVQAAMAIAQGIGGLKDLYEGIARWGVAFGDTAKAAKEMTDGVETVNTVAETSAAAYEASTAATTAATTAVNAATAANTANAAATEAAAAASNTAAAANTANASASNTAAAANTANATATEAATAATTAGVAATEAATAANAANATATEASTAANAANATATEAAATATTANTTATNTATAATTAGVAATEAATAANTANTAATAADTTAKGAQTVATEGATVAQQALNAAETAGVSANAANAASAAADATAKGAQAVATEGATVAQRGLNVAMKANPIGLIITAITALIGLFAWLKDDIVELLGGTEKMNAAWDKFKVVFAGVGNVIKQIVLGPIKTLITSIKTIAGSLGKLFSGDFSGAWDTLKDGVKELADGIKDTYDVVGNYQEAANKKSAELQEQHRKEFAAKKAKELEDHIKDNEAKSDSDWKYTEEGKKAYQELHKRRMEMYDKDSDEYKQAQRDMWMYNRDYQDRITKKEEDANKKRLEASKKALEEEKKTREKVLQEYNTLVEEYLKSDGEKMIDTWKKRRDALDAALEQEKADLKKRKISYAEYIEELAKIDEKYADKKAELEEQIALEKDNYNFNLQLTGFDQLTKSSELLAKSKEISYKWNVEIEGKDIDKIKYINDLYDEQRKIYEGEDGIIAKLAQRVDSFTEQYGADSELAIKATRELQTATVEYINLGIEKFKEISDVRVETLETEIEAEQAAMEKRQFMLEQEYLEYETSNNHLWEFENNYLSQMYKRWNAEDEIHKARIVSMQEMVAAYKAASVDMQLTEEERLKAKAEAAKIEREIEREILDYTLTVNQRKAESNDNYVTAVQDSLGGISQILGDVASAWETSIQTQVDAGEISEEEGEKQMENMRGIQSAIALINAFSSAVSAYQSMASIPYVGPALGAAAAAAALASGIAQVVAINKVKKGDKSGSESTRYAEMTPTAPEYNPTSVTNVTGGNEQEDLANALTKAPLKAYVVESDITDTQKKAQRRNAETSF